MSLVKRPSPKDNDENLIDFTLAMPRDFVAAFTQLQTELDAFHATLPDGTHIEPLVGKLQQGTQQKFLSYARQLKKEENLDYGPDISSYLAKHQPKPKLTPEQKTLQELKTKANGIHQAIKKLLADGAAEEKVQAKQKAFDKLATRIKKLEPDHEPT